MIYVDNREVPSDILTVLEAMGVPHEKKQLDIGDFIISGVNGEVYIERKEIKDFCSSLTSGHLNDQLVHMSESFYHSFLVIEDEPEIVYGEGIIDRKTLLSAIASAALKRADDGEKGAISVVMVPNKWDLALFLERIQRWMDDPKGLVRRIKSREVKVTGNDPQISCLCAIQGIGEKTAFDILTYFGSIGVIANAEEHEFLIIPGIGLPTAQKIRAFFRSHFVPNIG